MLSFSFGDVLAGGAGGGTFKLTLAAASAGSSFEVSALDSYFIEFSLV